MSNSQRKTRLDEAEHAKVNMNLDAMLYIAVIECSRYLTMLIAELAYRKDYSKLKTLGGKLSEPNNMNKLMFVCEHPQCETGSSEGCYAEFKRGKTNI